MTHYLTADSTRIDGRRYHYGDEVPAEHGAKLADRGLAVTSEDELNRNKVRRGLPYSTGGVAKAEEASTTGLAQTTGGDSESGEVVGNPLGAEPAHVTTDGEVRVPAGANDTARVARGERRGKAGKSE